MILGRDLLTYLGFNLDFSEHVIKADYGTLKYYIIPMVDLGRHEFKSIITEKITPEESFMNAYAE